MTTARRHPLTFSHPWNWRQAGWILVLAGLVGCRFLQPEAPPLPTPLATTQTPKLASDFIYPLDPDRFGPYIPQVSGTLDVDTRYGVQNPGVGDDGKCFMDAQGTRIPFSQLYHAGEDWFALDENKQVDGALGKGTLVRAIANGVVTWEEGLGREGNLIVLEHHLPDGRSIWSAYWHLSELEVTIGQAVQQGAPLGRLHDRGFNTHLHWEVRTFGDGSALFTSDSAGGRGTCNGHIAAVGYTWDDDPNRTAPDTWGYLEPGTFVEKNLSTAPSPEY